MSISIHKKSICIIWDEANKTLGTGFAFLNKAWFVTAKHVVMIDGLPRNNLMIGFVEGEKIECIVEAVHPELDLALLVHKGQPICDTPLMPGHHAYLDHEGFYYIGYSPKRSVGKNSNVEINHVKDYSVEYRERKENELLISFQAPYAEGGNSGGPLLGSGGAVVGVIIQNYEDKGIVYCRATDINALLDGLSYNNEWKI